MALKDSEITVGRAYTSKRWKGDRKVVRLVEARGLATVHFVDLRTSRTGCAPLRLFAASADGHGHVTNA